MTTTDNETPQTGSPDMPALGSIQRPKLWVMWVNAALSWSLLAFLYLIYLTVRNIKWAKRNGVPSMQYAAPLLTVVSVTTVLLLGAIGLGANSDNPASDTPLGNSAPPAATTIVPSAVPATRAAGGAQPDGVTNDPSTTSMYGFHPAKDDLAGPTGAVVWTIKDRAWCFTAQNVACLDQLYNTHGPSYGRDVALVSAGNRSNSAANWGATDIVVTKHDGDHFTANFMPTNPDPSAISDGRLAGSYTWSSALGVWMIDELVPQH
jgi:hypothetical protein